MLVSPILIPKRAQLSTIFCLDKRSAHQVYVQGGPHAATPKHIGMQFHPEWNAALVSALNTHFGAESPLPRDLTVHDRARFAKVAQWFWPLLDKWWHTATAPAAAATAAAVARI